MATTIRLLSYNILDGGLPDRLDDIVAVIESAEANVICLQECNGWHEDGLRLVREVAGRLAVNGYFARARSAYNLTVLTSYQVERFINHREAGLSHTYCEVLLRVPSGAALRVYNAHLDPHSEMTRLREVGALLAAMNPHLEADAALVGDLNSLAPGDTYRGHPVETSHETDPEMTKPIQVEVQPRIREAGWVDAYRRLDDDPGYTCPSDDPQVRIDYCYLSPGAAQRLRSCRLVDHPKRAAASDHIPLLTEFALDD